MSPGVWETESLPCLSSTERTSWIRFSDKHDDNPSVGGACVDTNSRWNRGSDLNGLNNWVDSNGTRFGVQGKQGLTPQDSNKYKLQIRKKTGGKFTFPKLHKQIKRKFYSFKGPVFPKNCKMLTQMDAGKRWTSSDIILLWSPTQQSCKTTYKCFSIFKYFKGS